MELSGCRASWDFFTDAQGVKSGRLRELGEHQAILCCQDAIEERRWLRVIVHAPAGSENISRAIHARVLEQYEMIDLWEDDSMTFHRHHLEWIDPLDAEWVALLTSTPWNLCDCGNLIAIAPKKRNAQALCGLCALRVVISGT